MTTVAKLKEAVNQALTKYNCCKTAVSTALQSPIINERNLTPKIAKFEEALVVVNEAHTSWFAKANLTPEQQAAETRNLEWLETVWVSHSELLQKAEDAILQLTADAAPPTHSNAQKLIIYTTQMESLQLDIQQQIANISDKIDDPNFSSQSHSTYLKMLDSHHNTFLRVRDTVTEHLTSRCSQHKHYHHCTHHLPSTAKERSTETPINTCSKASLHKPAFDHSWFEEY